jgi:hypothetical protein
VIRGAETSHVNACVIDPRPKNPIVDARATEFERRPIFPAREAPVGGDTLVTSAYTRRHIA